MSTTTRQVYGRPPGNAGPREPSPPAVSPSRRQPSTRSLLTFWIWMTVALLGEMGLIFFGLGPVFRAVFIELAAVVGRGSTADAPWFPVVRWTGFALSALILATGLRGLSREQEAARREADSWDVTPRGPIRETNRHEHLHVA